MNPFYLPPWSSSATNVRMPASLPWKIKTNSNDSSGRKKAHTHKHTFEMQIDSFQRHVDWTYLFAKSQHSSSTLQRLCVWNAIRNKGINWLIWIIGFGIVNIGARTTVQANTHIICNLVCSNLQFFELCSWWSSHVGLWRCCWRHFCDKTNLFI